jgi:DNA-binding NarL/FixJ family response regulator
MKVLVVSGSKFFREAVRFVLQDTVETVEVAPDLRGSEGPRAYDLILCDLSSLEEDPEVTDRIEHVKRSGTKVVVFSFDPPDRLRERAEELGADGYIHRPLDPTTVRETVLSFR